MPSVRYSDGRPPVASCGSCSTTHRLGVPCPPADRWLVSGHWVSGLIRLRAVRSFG